MIAASLPAVADPTATTRSTDRSRSTQGSEGAFADVLDAAIASGADRRAGADETGEVDELPTDDAHTDGTDETGGAETVAAAAVSATPVAETTLPTGGDTASASADASSPIEGDDAVPMLHDPWTAGSETAADNGVETVPEDQPEPGRADRSQGPRETEHGGVAGVPLPDAASDRARDVQAAHAAGERPDAASPHATAVEAPAPVADPAVEAPALAPHSAGVATDARDRSGVTAAETATPAPTGDADAVSATTRPEAETAGPSPAASGAQTSSDPSRDDDTTGDGGAEPMVVRPRPATQRAGSPAPPAAPATATPATPATATPATATPATPATATPAIPATPVTPAGADQPADPAEPATPTRPSGHPDLAPAVTAQTPSTPAAPVAPAASAAPPSAPPVAEQIVSHVTPLLEGPDGIHSVTIELTPDDLGRVTLEVTLDDGVVHVRMHAEDPSSRRLLASSLGQLRAALDSASLRAGSLDVGDGGANRQLFGGTDSGSRGRDRPAPHRPASASAAGAPATASSRRAGPSTRALDVLL